MASLWACGSVFPPAVFVLLFILLLAALANVNAVEVVCSEGSVALWALPLTCVIARLDALEAEDVEALCQYRILHPRVAARTR